MVAHMVNNSPAMQEAQIQSLHREASLEKLTLAFWPGEFHSRTSLAGYIQSIEWLTVPRD